VKEEHVMSDRLDGAPPPAKLTKIPRGVADTRSLLGDQGYADGQEGPGGAMHADPAIRALMAVSQMISGAKELSSILPGAVPMELMALLDMIRTTVPKQLEQLSQTRGLLGAADATAVLSPMSPVGMMGGFGMQQQQLPPDAQMAMQGGQSPVPPSPMGAPVGGAPMQPNSGAAPPQVPFGAGPPIRR
jgi:hypothetical protein